MSRTAAVHRLDTHEEPKRRRRKRGPGMSRKEFSDLADIPLRDVNRMIADGKLKVLPVGSLERIPYTELERIRREFGDPPAA